MDNENNAEMVKDNGIDTNDIKEINLKLIEELETAIAPGIIGFGCGCGAGNLGIYCG